MFAGSAGSSVEGRFSLPCVGDAKAAVVGENRTIPVRKGSFTTTSPTGTRFTSTASTVVYRGAALSGKGKVAQAGMAGGGDPADSSNTGPWVIVGAIVAFLVGMLAFLRMGPLPKRARQRSGMRAKRTHRLVIR